LISEAKKMKAKQRDEGVDRKGRGEKRRTKVKKGEEARKRTGERRTNFRGEAATT
jgi:hypothetical protein